MKNVTGQTDIEQRTAFVHEFMRINDDWFANPENALHNSGSLVGTFLMVWARTGAFPDDWGDSRLIYVQGKFEEWQKTASRPMWLLCMN